MCRDGDGSLATAEQVGVTHVAAGQGGDFPKPPVCLVRWQSTSGTYPCLSRQERQASFLPYRQWRNPGRLRKREGSAGGEGPLVRQELMRWDRSLGEGEAGEAEVWV